MKIDDFGGLSESDIEVLIISVNIELRSINESFMRSDHRVSRVDKLVRKKKLLKDELLNRILLGENE